MIASDLKLSADDQFLAGYSWFCCEVLLWRINPDAETGLPFLLEPTNAGIGTSVAFSHDGTRIALASGRLTSEVAIFELETGALLQRFFAPLSVQNIAWSADDSIVFANVTDFPLISAGFAYVGMGVWAFDAHSGENIAIFGHGPTSSYAVDMQPNQRVIGIDPLWGRILRWETGTNIVTGIDAALFSELETPNILVTPKVTDFALSHDDSLLATATSNEVIVWDMHTRTTLMSIAMSALRVDWSTSGNTLILLGSDSRLITMYVDS